MYELIVLGATFAAAGIARQYGDRCLIIERRARAGYEFFGALHLVGDETELYRQYEKCCPLFCTEIVSVEKVGDTFTCVTHGVDGYRTYQAKNVVDTRCSDEMCQSKTYNLLIESEETPSFSGVHWKKAKGENRYVLCCPVSPDSGFSQARAQAMDVIRQFSESQRLILSADAFDYQVKPGYPKMEGDIWCLPSKAYETPELAYEAGLSFGKEGLK